MLSAREIYWEIPKWLVAVHYGLFTISAIIFVLGILQRYYRWRLGQPDRRFNNYLVRIGRTIFSVLLQPRLSRDPLGWLMHGGIFYGFLLLYLGTLIVLVQADFHLTILTGVFYQYFSLVMDSAGLMLLLGLILALLRRFVIGSPNLDKSIPDAFAVILIFTIAFLGFWLEGIRIYHTELVQQSPLLSWSPVGSVFASVMAGLSLSPDMLKFTYPLWWFLHSTLAIVFIAYLPYSKLWHIFVGPTNIFLSNLKHPGILSTPDLEKSETFGVGLVKDFTWKHLLDLDACIGCGRCRAKCPTDLSGKPLSPKKFITDLRKYLDLINPQARKDEPKSICGGVITDDTVWVCTTCRYCQSHCPVWIEHIDKIIELRRNLVLAESRFPAELKPVFKSLETNYNPWAVSWDKREKWLAGLSVRVFSESSPNAEYLLWVGCAGATDERNIKVGQAVVRLLQKSGLDFAVLGNQEHCCGDPARRLGNEYLYQIIMQENMEILKQYQFRKIITACPHCYNTLKNEYHLPHVEVIHHTELIQQLISAGRLELSGRLEKIITYHDSCYLGRYNQIYEQPRTILKSIEGVRFKEMPRNHLESFCCGAGGGRMWLEEKTGQRINQMRTEEAQKTGVNLIVTACPYCLTMLSDGVKEKGLTEQIKVYDVAEIADGSI